MHVRRQDVLGRKRPRKLGAHGVDADGRVKVLVSACLAGERCRFDGAARTCAGIDEIAEFAELVPICPEVLGGLPVPRKPSEILGSRVVTCDGADVTEAFQRGAERAVRRALGEGCRFAVLKERSPSCGSKAVYDGTFSSVLVQGSGFAAAALERAGIRVYGESDLAKLKKDIAAE